MKLSELHGQVKNQNKTQHITLAVLSNITFEPYLQFLINKSFAENSISVNVISFGYLETLSNRITERIAEADIITVLPNFENFYPEIYNKELDSDKVQTLINTEISNMQNIISMVRSKSNASIIWFGYEDYYYKIDSAVGSILVQNGLVDKLNMQIVSQMKSNVVYIDMKRQIADIGIVNAYDNKNKYRWNSPYSQLMIEKVCIEIHKQYLITHGNTKKCVILDCDNVLWGGILSEDGIENVNLGSSGLGRSYQDFQRYLLFLYNHGVILSICSKNDMSDVMRMFRDHSEMILKEDHIACFQVNWNHKADNILRIAETLNIGLDSMVFIDDSDFEVQSIKQLLPEVTSIKYERDDIYSKLSCFNLKSDVDVENIRQRNSTYKTNQQRVKLKDNSKSYEDYLNALGMKIYIHPVLPIEYARIAELTQRTNKCTNGKRYTVAEIKEQIIFDLVMLYSVSVSDRFSNLGIVGAFEIEGATLTLFNLSCRALGREVESEMVKYISKNHQIHNIVYKSTGKNDAIKSFLAEAFPNVTFTNPENAHIHTFAKP